MRRIGATVLPLGDTLVGATTDACGTVEFHTTVMSDVVMKMQMVEGGIEIPAASSVSLEPGGLHAMCIDKQVDFAAGERIEMTLDFANAASQTIEIEIREK
jgi:copper(I)-binding protein